MPILTVRIQPIIQIEPGTGRHDVIASDRKVLLDYGPLVPINISLSSSMTANFAENGLQMPKVLSGQALIDTGASCSGVSDSALIEAGYNPIDTCAINSATQATFSCGVYSLRFSIGEFEVDVHRATGFPGLGSHGVLALIGRDILSEAVLVYNGKSCEFALAR